MGQDTERFGVGSGRGVALIDAVAGGVTGVSPPPVCLCLLVAGRLAFGTTATSLALAHPRVWIEPPQADPARPFPG